MIIYIIRKDNLIQFILKIIFDIEYVYNYSTIEKILYYRLDTGINQLCNIFLWPKFLRLLKTYYYFHIICIVIKIAEFNHGGILDIYSGGNYK